MGKFKTTSSDQEYWEQFCKVSDYFKKVSHFEIKDPSIPFPEIFGLDYSTDISILKEHLNDASFKKLAGRYRQYKLRNSRHLKTISVHENTLKRLSAFASANNFNFHTYDELFEFLIDPEERLEPKIAVSEPDSSVSLTKKFRITRARLTLRPHSWRTVLNQIDMAFRAGWLACKYLNGAKRTEKALDEKAAEFLTDIQTSD